MVFLTHESVFQEACQRHGAHGRSLHARKSISRIGNVAAFVATLVVVLDRWRDDGATGLKFEGFRVPLIMFADDLRERGSV